MDPQTLAYAYYQGAMDAANAVAAMADYNGMGLSSATGFGDAYGGYTDAYGGYADAYGGYADAFGGYSDAYGGYTDVFGGYTDAMGGYTDATGAYTDPMTLAAYAQGMCDVGTALGLSPY